MDSGEGKPPPPRSTADWYQTYYARKGADRNDLLTNSGVLFQHLAFERAVISVLERASDLERSVSRILDVGCGSAHGLGQLIQLGFSPVNLYGIDILRDRIASAHSMYPNVNVVCGDAASMPYASRMFDLVMESTMFVQLTDEALSRSIAQEMLRVTQPGGYLLLLDWRYGKPRNADYSAFSPARITRLFSVGSATHMVCTKRAALVPPVGRVLSRHLPAVYFLVQATLPFLVGAKATLLRKALP